jgi:hypothetical protein
MGGLGLASARSGVTPGMRAGLPPIGNPEPPAAKARKKQSDL